MPYRLARGLLLAFIVAAAFTASYRNTHAADPTIISVSPASATATVGDDVALDITVSNVAEQPGIGGYVIALTWDPTVLSLTSITDAGWVTGGQIIVVCTTPTIDNVAGTAEADCTPVVGFGNGVSTAGSHVLAHATFHAKASGQTSIELAGSSLLNPSNVAIVSTIANGSATIAAPAAATPTKAATATAQPTSTPTTASATNTPSSSATAELILRTPSTKPTQGTLSKVEVPPTGSGSPGGDGMTWWVPVLAAAAAVLLGGGGVAAFRRANRRTDE